MNRSWWSPCPTLRRTRGLPGAKGSLSKWRSLERCNSMLWRLRKWLSSISDNQSINQYFFILVTSRSSWSSFRIRTWILTFNNLKTLIPKAKKLTSGGGGGGGGSGSERSERLFWYSPFPSLRRVCLGSLFEGGHLGVMNLGGGREEFLYVEAPPQDPNVLTFETKLDFSSVYCLSLAFICLGKLLF